MGHDWVVPAELDGQHVLAVPGGSDVVALATAWFPDARWEQQPSVSAPAVTRPAGARFRGVAVQEAAVVTTGSLRLGDAGLLVGPVTVEGHDLYGLAEPSERAVAWTTAAARHVAGLTVTPDRLHRLAPSAGAAVDLTLWSAQPVSAADVVPVVRPALSGSRLGGVPQPHGGAPTPFSLTATFEYDGAIVVSMERPGERPAVLDALDWREHGPWAYRVVWEPLEPGELATESPSPLHVIARDRVAPSMARVAAALREAVGGTVVDSSGFVVTPDELRHRSARR
ncbi:hypothetical protein [Cellulomonas edaphi]|uniref:Uncharacterized protein n=1 Tax=Cellulomonas edaphi TaxID=3053468 RepID=A0ABT7S2Z7_9CELL|nr:hypothetical protein [Cellulomons edaphi]MDM7829982.1 hypothetical protein [Cellulomons edaphi]